MPPSKMDERDAAIEVVRVLKTAGHVAYLAGGCVRDRLLGFNPTDYDVATDAPPDRVGGLFRHCRYVGEAFGVVIVRLGGHSIEVSTFRVDQAYKDGRRPSAVTFTDARTDATRRDFTINGLFEDPLATDPTQNIIDYVGGREDLERRTVRAIGDPSARFAEDYLRMLRAVRFAARLGFEIESGTAEAIRAHADRLSRISRERIGQELAWMLTPGERTNPALAVQTIQSLQLDAAVLDETHTGRIPIATVDRLCQDRRRDRSTQEQVTYPTVLAAWAIDRHFLPAHAQVVDTDTTGGCADLTSQLIPWVNDSFPQIIKRWRKALCLSNDVRDAVGQTLKILATLIGWDSFSLAQRKRVLAKPQSQGALALLKSLYRQQPVDPVANKIDCEARYLLSRGVAPAPWVNGNDLIELGIKPGRAIGRLLKEVYDVQLDGTVMDRAGALDWVRNRCRSDSAR